MADTFKTEATTDSADAISGPNSSFASTDENASGSKKKETAIHRLHPLQDKALRYASFMLADTNKAQTVPQMVKEGIGRQLAAMQKQGLEFPPKMQAELTRLKLLG